VNILVSSYMEAVIEEDS